MKTAVAETSLDAFNSFSIPDLQKKERVVLEYLRDVQMALTREQLAQRLGWKESAVCGRVNSLVTKKVLEEIEGGKTSSGRTAKLVRIPFKGQGELFA